MNDGDGRITRLRLLTGAGGVRRRHGELGRRGNRSVVGAHRTRFPRSLEFIVKQIDDRNKTTGCLILIELSHDLLTPSRFHHRLDDAGEIAAAILAEFLHLITDRSVGDRIEQHWCNRPCRLVCTKLCRIRRVTTLEQSPTNARLWRAIFFFSNQQTFDCWKICFVTSVTQAAV